MSESSTAASRLCCSIDGFAGWAKSVNLNLAIHDVLPDELQSLLDATRTLPVTLANEDSEAYQPYKRRFPLLVEELAESITYSPSAAAPDSGAPTDTTLAADLVDALFPIFSISHHTITIDSKLTPLSGRPFEADWRTPLDQLANFVWMYEVDRGFSHALECQLQLPKTGRVPQTKCDSAVHFELAGPQIQLLRPNVLRACATLLNPRNSIHVLHWVTEYKKAGGQLEQDAVRQVRMGMVAGLYQRRTLGFPDHYIFGTAHSGDSLRVFAGTWVPKKAIDVPVPVATINNREAEVPKGAIETPSPEQKSQKNGSGSSVGGSARSRKRRELAGGKSVSAEELPPAETQDKDELEASLGYFDIKIYELGQYLLRSPFDMAQLYLLMRGSRRLGLEYTAAIGGKDVIKRLRGALAKPPYDWPSQPGSKSKPNPPSTSGSKRKLDGIQEEEGTNAEHEHDLDMKSVTTNSSSIIGDPVQEAVWEDEWRASYKEAIEKVGRGLPVHLSCVKRSRSESSEDRILRYVRSATDDVVDV